MPLINKTALTIHQAANEIGGNCLEISSSQTRLLFDFGLPLISIKEKRPPAFYRLDIEGVYKNQIPKVSAVFLTHAHPDHYGLLTELNTKIPVYASQATINLLINVAPLFGNDFSQINFIPLNAYETIKIGPFTVKSLPVDHSAVQSFAYQIKIGKKRLLYTGDLRAHGKCAYLTKKLCNMPSPDYLILEGTSLSRPYKHLETESDLQKRLTEALSCNKLPVIYFSAQNLDRFVSVYKAAKLLKKSIVIDPYTCFVLEQFAHLGSSIPKWNWKNIRVYFANNSLTRKMGKHKFLYKSKKISLKEILDNPNRFIIKDNFVIRRKLLRKTNKLCLIHSAWEGYLKEQDNAFKEDAKEFNLQLITLHTSGHGDLYTLEEIVRNLKPRIIIPIHTICAEEYEYIFNVKTHILKDGESLNI